MHYAETFVLLIALCMNPVLYISVKLISNDQRLLTMSCSPWYCVNHWRTIYSLRHDNDYRIKRWSETWHSREELHPSKRSRSCSRPSPWFSTLQNRHQELQGSISLRLCATCNELFQRKKTFQQEQPQHLSRDELLAAVRHFYVCKTITTSASGEAFRLIVHFCKSLL